MAQYDRVLVLPYTTALNKSSTKSLCVGLEWISERSFKPVIQIISNDSKKSIFLDIETQWLPLVKMCSSFLWYYDGDDSNPEFKVKYTQPIHLGDLTISFPSTNNERGRGILFGQGDVYLLFMKKTLKTLSYLNYWVNGCIKFSTWCPTEVFSDFIIRYLRKNFGGVRIHKETLQHYLLMTASSVQNQILCEISDNRDLEGPNIVFNHTRLPLFYNDILVKNFDQLYDFIYPDTAPNSLNPVKYRGPTPAHYVDHMFKDY